MGNYEARSSPSASDWLVKDIGTPYGLHEHPWAAVPRRQAQRVPAYPDSHVATEGQFDGKAGAYCQRSTTEYGVSVTHQASGHPTFIWS